MSEQDYGYWAAPVNDFATQEDIRKATALLEEALDLLQGHTAREADRNHLRERVKAIKDALAIVRPSDSANWYK